MNELITQKKNQFGRIERDEHFFSYFHIFFLID